MNDRELMKKIYDGRCADEMSAAEILEGSAEPARVRSKAPVIAAAAAAAVLAVGTAVFLKYKAAPVKPSGDGGESVTAADSVSDSSESSADISADPWEPYAVSMPDPFRQDGMTPVTDHNGTESRDVIEYMESTGDGADSSQSEEPQYSEELRIKQTEEQFLAHLSQSETEITAVFDDVYLQDITAAENAEQLKSLSKSRCYVLPADSTSGNHFHYAEFNSGSERMRYNAGTGELAPVLSSEVLEQKLSFYPDHSEIKKFRIANVGSFTELYCFTSGGRELVIPYDPDRQAVPNAISEYPLNGQVYSFDAIRTWAGRKRQFSHYSENSVVCCDLAEKDERVYTVTEEQLLQLREWYKAHEADAVNVPADGSQGDNRFIKCKGAAYAGFAVDGGYVVISRAYGSEDSVKGINVTVTDENGSASVRWYADGPDTEGITALFDSLFGE